MALTKLLQCFQKHILLHTCWLTFSYSRVNYKNENNHVFHFISEDFVHINSFDLIFASRNMLRKISVVFICGLLWLSTLLGIFTQNKEFTWCAHLSLLESLMYTGLPACFVCLFLIPPHRSNLEGNHHGSNTYKE